MPLFNIGCAGFGQGRARQIAKGAKIVTVAIKEGFARTAVGERPAE